MVELKNGKTPEKTKIKPVQPHRAPAAEATAEPVFSRLEFHRNAIALMPAADDPSAGVAIMVLSDNLSLSYRGCSCSTFKGKNCSHIKTLGQAINNAMTYGLGLMVGFFVNGFLYERMDSSGLFWFSALIAAIGGGILAAGQFGRSRRK